jgi:tRNA threonylcarbamoyladenosine biosynthesis protein TsaB
MEYQNRTKILSIESSSSVCSVCLSVDDLIMSEYNIYEKNVHDKLLAKAIKTILDDMETNINEISAIAVSSGPGSFTGLRIGFAIAKGICFDGETKFLAIPTLKAIANEQLEIAKFSLKDFIFSIIYSNENLFYTQIFDLRLKELSEVKILTNEEIKNIFGNNYYITGPAAKIIKPETPDFSTKLTASTIAKLAVKYYKDSNFVDPSEVTPDYYQKFKIK